MTDEFESARVALCREVAAAALAALKASGMTCHAVDDATGAAHGRFKRWIGRLMDGRDTNISTIAIYFAAMKTVPSLTLVRKENSNDR